MQVLAVGGFQTEMDPQVVLLLTVRVWTKEAVLVYMQSDMHKFAVKPNKITKGVPTFEAPSSLIAGHGPSPGE